MERTRSAMIVVDVVDNTRSMRRGKKRRNRGGDIVLGQDGTETGQG